MDRPVTIVGGGIAGLTLGIALRQNGVPVFLWEAGRYPRHRVCGEFISGEGEKALERLGLLPLLEKAGTLHARTAAFFDRAVSVPPRPLPLPALCISRFVFDQLLADEFQRLGGNLRSGERWHGEDEPGIVHASGRRMEPIINGFRWIGLKAHARNVSLSADLELHFLASGYVGVSRLPGGLFNVCGMFRSKTPFSNLSKTWRNWLAGEENSVLRQRLAHARIEPKSFCSVAGLDTRARKGTDECRIGDALTMIPPMTGNGMSMAIEAAELASAPLVEYSRGVLEWLLAQRKIAEACDRRFRRRLRYAAWLQQIAFLPSFRNVLIGMTARSGALGNALFSLTR